MNSKEHAPNKKRSVAARRSASLQADCRRACQRSVLWKPRLCLVLDSGSPPPCRCRSSHTHATPAPALPNAATCHSTDRGGFALSQDGRMAASARAGAESCGAAATISSSSALHSFTPVASSSRNFWLRESAHSTPANAAFGMVLNTCFDTGYSETPCCFNRANAPCMPRATRMASAHVAPA